MYLSDYGLWLSITFSEDSTERIMIDYDALDELEEDFPNYTDDIAVRYNGQYCGDLQFVWESNRILKEEAYLYTKFAEIFHGKSGLTLKSLKDELETTLGIKIVGGV